MTLIFSDISPPSENIFQGYFPSLCNDRLCVSVSFYDNTDECVCVCVCVSLFNTVRPSVLTADERREGGSVPFCAAGLLFF